MDATAVHHEVVESEGIRDGDELEIEVCKAKRSWFGSAPGIGSMTHEDELDAHE
ncbi:MAG: hypothetical protein KGI38_10555 [Thaumarchaeota archaeon]|nr:hypothetical protein [Nitrososphaerota archaeon]